MERELNRVIPSVFPLAAARCRGEPRQDIRRSWYKACRQAGCPGRIKHDPRRSAVRDMVQAGISARVAMTITGRRTRKILLRHHIVSPGDLQDAARKLSRTILRHNPGHNAETTP